MKEMNLLARKVSLAFCRDTFARFAAETCDKRQLGGRVSGGGALRYCIEYVRGGCGIEGIELGRSGRERQG